MERDMADRIGVGFVGSGFITRFHIESWQAVRFGDVRGVWSPNPRNAASAAELANRLGVGEARAFSSIRDMVNDPLIDAIWICGPNHRRIDNLTEIVEAVTSGRGNLVGVACEKPLARNVTEARKMLEMVRDSGLLHGYLEDQLFTPGLARSRDIIWRRGVPIAGRPYLARAAEEHSGPHNPWFWQGDLQGGGVLSDMMCHSVEVARFLLTKPGDPRDSIRLKKVSAQIASLKWSRPEYVGRLKEAMGPEVDYSRRPSEDFARATMEYEDGHGNALIAETTTSWSYVGAGLRLSAELLGPEYSMSYNSLDSGVRVFLSRNIHGSAGEDLVEKQNAEQGLMPIVGNEAAAYGYEGENRYFAKCFAEGRQPEYNFEDGVAVMELLMAAYMSAEKEQTIHWPPDGLESFIPAVAQGTWNPRG